MALLAFAAIGCYLALIYLTASPQAQQGTCASERTVGGRPRRR